MRQQFFRALSHILHAHLKCNSAESSLSEQGSSLSHFTCAVKMVAQRSDGSLGGFQSMFCRAERRQVPILTLPGRQGQDHAPAESLIWLVQGADPDRLVLLGRAAGQRSMHCLIATAETERGQPAYLSGGLHW